MFVACELRSAGIEKSGASAALALSVRADDSVSSTGAAVLETGSRCNDDMR